MNTLRLNTNNPDDINTAADILRNGGLVAIPTETVYGLAANALNGEAVSKIFVAKGRPNDNPLIVHVASLEEIPPLVEQVDPRLYDLADKNVDSYWEYLQTATPETVLSIARALEQAGETEMVKAFVFIMENYRGEPAKIRNFVIGNQKYIRGRIMAYIKRNIELFY